MMIHRSVTWGKSSLLSKPLSTRLGDFHKLAVTHVGPQKLVHHLQQFNASPSTGQFKALPAQSSEGTQLHSGLVEGIPLIQDSHPLLIASSVRKFLWTRKTEIISGPQGLHFHIYMYTPNIMCIYICKDMSIYLYLFVYLFLFLAPVHILIYCMYIAMGI